MSKKSKKCNSERCWWNKFCIFSFVRIHKPRFVFCTNLAKCQKNTFFTLSSTSVFSEKPPKSVKLSVHSCGDSKNVAFWTISKNGFWTHFHFFDKDVKGYPYGYLNQRVSKYDTIPSWDPKKRVQYWILKSRSFFWTLFGPFYHCKRRLLHVENEGFDPFWWSKLEKTHFFRYHAWHVRFFCPKVTQNFANIQHV